MKSVRFLVGAVGTALLVACGSGADGAPGEKGADGAKGDNGAPGKEATVTPSLDFVTPNKGVLDRTIEVTLSASGTKFSGSPKVDFGAGITVSEVKALSATAISAKLVIAANAAIGTRDVTVDGQKIDKAFSVIPAFAAQLTGTVQQGAVVSYVIMNQDPASPFDKDNLSLVAPDLLDLGFGAESNLYASGAVIVPPLATGTAAFSFANMDAEGKPRTSYVGAGDTMKITARVAPPLATNVAPAVVNLGAQLASTYGKVTVPAATTAIIDYRVQVAGNATTSPRGFVFGKGGKAADLLGVISPPTDFFGNPEPPPYDLRMVVPFPQQAAAEDEFLVLFDASGRGGAATTTTTVVKAELVAEGAAAHATAPTAQDLATLQPIPVNLANDIGGKVVTGNLSAGNEVDVYRITVAAADRLQIAISGEGEYDVVVSTDGSSDPEGDNTIGYVYSPAKGLPGNDVVDAGTETTLYIAVLPYQARNGKYALSIRKIAAN
jgi:hypothetical protein